MSELIVVDCAGNWPSHAACRDADPELFGQADVVELRGIGKGSAETLPRIQDALSYCDRCPVKRDCGDYAANFTDYAMVGVWGGEYITRHVALERLLDAKNREEAAA